MKQSLIAVIGAALLFSCGSCQLTGMGGMAEETGKNRLRILTWNVQAVFDGEENGAEYEEYTEPAGWTPEKYSGRLNSLARAIGQIEPEAPDILALEEIENARVLEDLVRGPLSKHGYRHTFFANIPGASLGIGVISRTPFTRTLLHSFAGETAGTPRPVAEVWVRPGNEDLALLVCHWKSKVGGDELTEPQRRASARVLLRRLREIEREAPSTPVLIMGDLNENYDEYYRQAGAYLCALLPDDPRTAELTGLYGAGGKAALEIQQDFLVLTGNKPPRAEYFAPGTLALYSPWKGELKDGSYLYRNQWETIDHFLINGALFDNLGWEFSACQVLNGEPFMNPKAYPDAYVPRTGAGLRDHLPLLLTVEEIIRQ
ncbi:MAG: endonuclease/exonuclease/phosphatase family protein [Treponema sp.]|jgi:endonuclease/exonuclease/phosphatase family metal-dependent hydrolase|nr:endonuclease/exonuclease/phosphatase family protein [Treponema sp.]